MPTNARNNRRIAISVYKRKAKFYNYDFHQNWDKITNLLRKTEAQFHINRYRQLAFEQIKDARFYHSHGGNKLVGTKAYKPTRERTNMGLNINDYKTLHSFAPTDGYCMMFEFIKELLLDTPLDQLKVSDQTKTLIIEYNKYLREDSESDDETDDHERFYRGEELEELLLKSAGYHHETRPYFIGFLVPCHMCHWYNPTIGLYLAKKLMPEEQWRVFHTNDHTTVVSLTSNKIFDAVAWIWGSDDGKRIDRLIQVIEYELLGKEMPRLVDDSLGGMMAMGMCIYSD